VGFGDPKQMPANLFSTDRPIELRALARVARRMARRDPEPTTTKTEPAS
jgi:hypothetical protein